MGVTKELVENVLRTEFGTFSSEVVERSRDRVIDVMGCIVAGAHAPGCSMVVDLVKEWGGREESSILVHGGKAPAHNAAMVNSIMARSYDFEPAGPFVDGKSIPAHVSGTTVPTALAVAERTGAGGKEFLSALILGDDITSRIVAAADSSLDSGWDCTGTANMFGAAAIAGRLLGLNKEQLLNAFGIVVNQCAGTFQNIFDGVHSFKLPQGLAARAGIISAELARKGFIGLQEPLLSRHGYFALYSQSCRPEILVKDLGTNFFADYTLKPYPCCRSNHAAIDCVLELTESVDIDPNELNEIIVNVSGKGYDFAVGQPFKVGEIPQINAAFSLQYNVANAFLRKSVKLEHYTDDFIRDSKVMEIIKKIRLHPALPDDKLLAAEIVIKMNNGDEYRKLVSMPKGNGVFTPLDEDEKREKYRSNIAFSRSIPSENAEKCLSMMYDITNLENVRDIVKLFIS